MSPQTRPRFSSTNAPDVTHYSTDPPFGFNCVPLHSFKVFMWFVSPLHSLCVPFCLSDLFPSCLCLLVRGHPFMMSTWRGSGSGGLMLMEERGVSSMLTSTHRLEPTDVILSSSHAKELAFIVFVFRQI